MTKKSKQAAGGWTDINAEKMIKDIYKSRKHSKARDFLCENATRFTKEEFNMVEYRKMFK